MTIHTFLPLSRVKKGLAGLLAMALILALGACATEPVKQPSRGHIGLEASPDVSETLDIPQPVTRLPALPPPSAEQRLETYTVIVNEVPVKELLFALARDARLNLDIYDNIQGTITINAIDQTLPQILDRISRQTGIRYQIENNNLIVSADTPYLRNYKVAYVNMSRESEGRIDLATQIASGGTADVGGSGGGRGQGGNNSSMAVKNTSDHDFWRTLFITIAGIVGDRAAAGGGARDLSSANVSINREAGLISVRASGRHHAEIQELLDTVMNSVQRQVLIEATVAEVNLNKGFQAGVDWERVTDSMVGPGLDGVQIVQETLGGNLSAPPTLLLQYGDVDGNTVVNASVRMLEQFGDVQVLSSPKIMAMNNQMSILKVVDNRVYFTIEAETSQNQVSSITTFQTNLHTVPVGFVMSMVPYISESDQIILNIRPTISRILGFVDDPNPVLKQANVVSSIPEIQVREMESVLRLNNGQIAVLGGLMQDSVSKNRDGVPFLSALPIIGNLFKYRDDQINKTELVIFLRAVVIKEPSLSGDLQNFKPFMPGDSPERTGDL